MPCGFDVAWVGPCALETPCPRHERRKCWCGAQATRECDNASSLVCGTGLCAEHVCLVGGHGSGRGEAQFQEWRAGRTEFPVTFDDRSIRVVDPPERRPLFLEVVGHEEYVEVSRQYDPQGRVTELQPIDGSKTAFLKLRTPDGSLIRAEIPWDKLDSLLALMSPPV